MSGLRFKAGELAVVAHPEPGTHPFWFGMLVTIEAVGPLPAWHTFPNGSLAPAACDYLVRAATGAQGCSLDRELRKIEPPDEQQEVTRQTELPEALPA